MVRVRMETADTATLFLAADERFEYAAGQFLTIDPRQFLALKQVIGYLEDAKGQREKPRAYSLASAPHEEHAAITIKEEPYISGETVYPPLVSPLLTYQIPAGSRMKVSGFTGAYTYPTISPSARTPSSMSALAAASCPISVSSSTVSTATTACAIPWSTATRPFPTSSSRAISISCDGDTLTGSKSSTASRVRIQPLCLAAVGGASIPICCRL